jgi:hypothetical protein
MTIRNATSDHIKLRRWGLFIYTFYIRFSQPDIQSTCEPTIVINHPAIIRSSFWGYSSRIFQWRKPTQSYQDSIRYIARRFKFQPRPRGRCPQNITSVYTMGVGRDTFPSSAVATLGLGSENTSWTSPNRPELYIWSSQDVPGFIFRFVINRYFAAGHFGVVLFFFSASSMTPQ